MSYNRVSEIGLKVGDRWGLVLTPKLVVERDGCDLVFSDGNREFTVKVEEYPWMGICVFSVVCGGITHQMRSSFRDLRCLQGVLSSLVWAGKFNLTNIRYTGYLHKNLLNTQIHASNHYYRL